VDLAPILAALAAGLGVGAAAGWLLSRAQARGAAEAIAARAAADRAGVEAVAGERARRVEELEEAVASRDEALTAAA
jgi:hypothetical protein